MAYDHGSFRVRNLAEAIRFYTDKLGFRFLFAVESEQFGEKGAFLEYNGARLELIETIGISYQPVKPERPYCPHLCFAEGMQGVTECASTVADRSPVLKTENGVRYFGPIAVGAEGDPEELVLREGTRVIASGAFRELFSLQKVHLPASIVSICDGAFTDCIRLREINVPQNAQVSKTAFCGCEQYQPKN